MRISRSSLAVVAFVATSVAALGGARADAVHGDESPVPDGAIKHVIVIDLENEEFDASFGPSSPATYLNDALVPQGQLLTQYFATGHFSTDNYLAQISGQAPNQVSGNDCITNATTFASTYTDVTPGTPAADQVRCPGQVDGRGCVYPAHVQTIGNQLDVRPGSENRSGGLAWRQYAEDMGNDPSRDFGTPDPAARTDTDTSASPARPGCSPSAPTCSTPGPRTTDRAPVRRPGELWLTAGIVDYARSPGRNPCRSPAVGHKPASQRRAVSWTVSPFTAVFARRKRTS